MGTSSSMGYSMGAKRMKMGEELTLQYWMLEYIIEPRSISERTIRMEKVLAHLDQLKEEEE
tara:strand:+ start:931 stop:1113 length:183 start_codon:yes stop_codon:yes gene_type:complete